MFRPFSVATSTLLLVSAAVGQTIPAGLTLSSRQLAATTTHILALGGGRTVTFDGSDLQLSVPGQAPATLLHFGIPVFGSFVIRAASDRVLFGENSTGGVYLVPLQGPPPTGPLAQLTLNYDAAMLAPGVALVSAKTGGWAATDNDLVRIELATGAVQMLAHLPGASGPIAVADNGDAYYATASPLYPTPPGTASILRFSQATISQAVSTGAVLHAADAAVVRSGLDAASDICIDDDGDLLFADWFNQTVGELNDATSGNSWLGAPLLDFAGTGLSAANLQIVRGHGGTFEPFQPPASRLLVQATDYATANDLIEVTSVRPILTASPANPIPTGAVTLVVTRGPANGLGLVALGSGSASDDQFLTIAGFEQLLVWSSSLAGAPLTAIYFDAAGKGALAFGNPGFAAGMMATAQVATIAANGVLGSSQPVLLQLGL